MNTVFLLAFTAACALSDVRTGIVPNTLIGSGLLCGCAMRCGMALTAGTGHFPVRLLLDGAAGFLLPYVLLGLPVLLHMLGGGDVKLFSVLGLWLGCRGCVMVLWASLLTGAVCSLGVVLYRRNLWARLRCFAEYAAQVRRTGRLAAYPGEEAEGRYGSGRFPFAAAIFPALAAVLLMRGGV